MYGEKYFSDKKIQIVFLVAIFTFVSVLPTFLMFFQQRVVDSLNSDMVEMNYILCLLFGIFIFFTLKLIHSDSVSNISMKIREDMSRDLISAYIRNTAFGRKRENISISVVINQYLEGIINDYYKGMLNMSSNILIAISSYVYAFFINRWIAVISLVFMMVNLCINRRMANFVSELQRENAQVNSLFLTKFSNLIRNLSVFKTNKLKAKSEYIFENSNEKYALSNLKLNNKLSGFSTVNAVYYAIQKYGIIIFAVYLFFIKDITAGELISCIFLASFLSSPLIKLGESLRQIASTKSYREELKNISKVNTENFSMINSDENGFVYEADQIGYHEPEEKILFKNVSLKFLLWKKYLILGKNGSGKSTLLSDFVLSLKNSVYSKEIGVVFQNEGLLKGSISENIKFFNDVDDSMIIELLSILKLKKDINQTVGNKLSRGEIQRILIARHIANGKKIIILDEALSGVEKELQKEIMEYLFKLDITLIMVSHKIEKYMIKQFDSVFLVSDSKIHESGSATESEDLYEKYMD